VRKDLVCKRKKYIFHQDNVPAHKSVLTIGKLKAMHYELLEHPTYSPDLAPSDYQLFPKYISSSLVSIFLRIEKRLQL
jgi:transposase